MLAKTLSGSVSGVEGLIIRVEVDLALGLPGFSTVGLAEGALREAKDQVRQTSPESREVKNSSFTPQTPPLFPA